MAPLEGGVDGRTEKALFHFCRPTLLTSLSPRPRLRARGRPFQKLYEVFYRRKLNGPRDSLARPLSPAGDGRGRTGGQRWSLEENTGLG